MADHLRDQIIAAVVTACTGLTTTGSNVFPDEDDPIERGVLPCLTIKQGTESGAPITMSYPRTVRAVFDIDIAAYASRTHAQADVRKLTNTICKEVSAALYAARPLAGVAQIADLSQTDPDLSGDAQKPTAIAAMRLQLVYFFKENAPDVAP